MGFLEADGCRAASIEPSPNAVDKVVQGVNGGKPLLDTAKADLTVHVDDHIGGAKLMEEMAHRLVQGIQLGLVD